MKKSFLISAFVLVFAAGMSALVLSCGSKGSDQQEQAQEPSEEQAPVAEEVAYICPMHPEITGKKGDTCSKCGMDLEEPKADGDTTHTHDDHH